MGQAKENQHCHKDDMGLVPYEYDGYMLYARFYPVLSFFSVLPYPVCALSLRRADSSSPSG